MEPGYLLFLRDQTLMAQPFSLRRLENALKRSTSLFGAEEEFEQLRAVKRWSEKTGDGSLSDLDFRPLPRVWDEVASDHGNCMGRKCPMYGKCFYYKARRRLQNRTRRSPTCPDRSTSSATG